MTSASANQPGAGNGAVTFLSPFEPALRDIPPPIQLSTFNLPAPSIPRENRLYRPFAAGEDADMRLGGANHAFVYLPKWEDIQICIITC
jgi:hypothetical protein